MSNPMTDERWAEIEASTEGHRTGPWRWFGDTSINKINLATIDRGRTFVMTFRRWGMRGAAPEFQKNQNMVRADSLCTFERTYRRDIDRIEHPDAHLIAAAPELLAEVRRLRKDQTDWRRGVDLINDALFERKQNTLCCVDIAHQVLAMGAETERLKAENAELRKELEAMHHE
jgi:hypothetical protein